MPLAIPARRLLGALAATAALMSLGGATVGWRGAGEPVGSITAAAAGEAPAEPRAPTSTTIRTSTTSIASSSTSTTLEPVPVSTTVRPTVARTPATTTAPAPTVAATPAPPPTDRPSGPSPAERCAAALRWVAERGLTLPAGWGYRCPGLALENGTPRWGIACWNCQGAGSWIAVDVARIGSSDATLRYVVAHEICHAHDYAGLGLSTELGADLCAALHGAPRP